MEGNIGERIMSPGGEGVIIKRKGGIKPEKTKSAMVNGIEGKLKSDIVEFQKGSSVYFPHAEGVDGQKEAAAMLEKLRKDLRGKANN